MGRSEASALRAWLAVALCVFATRGAGAGRLPLETFTGENGLPEDFVRRVVRDSQGFLWFCTPGGLSRYDGAEFVTYGAEHGLGSVNVHNVIETRSGSYVVSTGHGVYRIDPAPGARFEAMLEDGAAPRVALTRLIEARDGTIWVGGEPGFFRLEPAGARWRLAPVGLATSPGSRDGAPFVTGLVEDAAGGIWVATFDEVYRRPPGAERFQPVAGVRVYPTHDVPALARDREGRVWVGTLGRLVRFGVPVDGGAPAIERDYGEDHGVPETEIQDVLESENGTIWVGTTRGLLELPPDRAASGGPWRWYRRPHGLSGDAVTSLAEDLSGNIWLAQGNAGAMRLARGGMIAYDDRDGLLEQDASALLETHDGELWMMTSSRHLHRYEGGAFRGGRTPMSEEALEGAWGWHQIVLRDRSGDWWLGTGEGLYRYSGIRGPDDLAAPRATRVYTTRDGLPGNVVFRVYEDAHDDIWICTFPSEGALLSRWSRATGKIESFGDADGLPPGSAPTAFAEDASGTLWIGFYRGGVARRVRDRFEFFPPGEGCPKGQVRALFTDSAHGLWIGTHLGAAHVDDPAAAKPAFTTYGREQGLLSTQVTCVAEDRRGRVYLGTARGVDRIDVATGKIRHYGRSAGLPNSFVMAALRDRTGAVWFGVYGGLARLEPGDDPPAPAPAVRIGVVKVGGRDVALPLVGAAQVSPVEISRGSGPVEIGYFSIGFGIDLSRRYQYRLEGTDTEWSEPSPVRRVRFESLRPGSYRFLVRAVDSSGIVSPAPAVVALDVLPPVWARGWFVAIAAATLVGGATTAYRWRIRRIRMRERELEGTVAARTRELEAAKMDLEESNRTLEQRVASGISALQESERMAAYGRLVAGVAHEVRHPVFAMQSATYLLSRRLETSKGEIGEQLEMLEMAAARVGHLMDDLLEFARPPALTPTPCDPRAVLARAVEVFMAEHGGEGPRPVIEDGADLPEANVDAPRLTQVLVNLMENAKKHAATATAIRVRADVDDAARRLRFVVEDDGPGISAEHLPHVFEPFYTSGKGTGLGLAIVQRVVQDHGGTIVAESPPGGGARFIVSVPLDGPGGRA